MNSIKTPLNLSLSEASSDASGNDESASYEEEGEFNKQISVTYPTPPPDTEEDVSPDDKAETQKNKMVAKKKLPLGKLIINSISALNERTGSSVVAIIKYIKSTGYEVNDERRFSKLVLKTLKLAITNGSVEQLKRSFKLTAQAKSESKAIQKMKAKKEKKLERENMEKLEMKKKPKAVASANVLKDKETTKRPKPTERKTGKAKVIKTTNTKTKSKKATVGEVVEAQAHESPDSELPQTSVKSTTETKPKPKPKATRKSIGTLAKSKATKKMGAKLNRDSVKKLVAGKDLNELKGSLDVITDLGISSKMVASTPYQATNTKSKGKRAPKATKS